MLSLPLLSVLTLGGALAAPMLFLRLADPYCRGIASSPSDKGVVYALFRVPKRRPASAAPTRSHAVATVQRMFLFNRLADFQYLPSDCVEGVDAAYVHNVTLDPMAMVRRFGRRPVNLLPPVFSRTDLVRPYALMKSVKVARASSAGKAVVFDLRGDDVPVPEAPAEVPTDAVKKPVVRRGGCDPATVERAVARVRTYFDIQPLWSVGSLVEQLQASDCAVRCSVARAPPHPRRVGNGCILVDGRACRCPRSSCGVPCCRG